MLTDYITGFRKQLMHSHANRAGYLDLDGCTIVDLLPRYIPLQKTLATLVDYLNRRLISFIVTSSPPALNVPPLTTLLASLLFAEKVLWLSAATATRKWVCVLLHGAQG